MTIPTTYIIVGRAVQNRLEQADGSVKVEPGGSALLQAQLIKMLDPAARVILVTDLGNDAQGDEFVRLLDDMGIETPSRIDREILEVPSLYAFWPFGAKSYDPKRSYLDSVPIEYSALPNYKLPDDIRGPIIVVPTSEGTTVEGERNMHIVDQTIELGALCVWFPNSRPDKPDRPDLRKLKDTYLPQQLVRTHYLQFAAKDSPHMFGDKYGRDAIQHLRSYNSHAWIEVTNGAAPTAIYKPGEISPDIYIGVPEISGLPETFNKTNAGTVFGARMVVEMNRCGLNAPFALENNPSKVIVQLAECTAWGNWEASQLLARNNGVDPDIVKKSRLALEPTF